MKDISQRVKFFKHMDAGNTMASACRAVGIHYKTGALWKKKYSGWWADYYKTKAERELLRKSGVSETTRKAIIETLEVPPLLARSDLCPEALRALDDFGYFRERYLGRQNVPWQIEAGQHALEWLLSDDTEYVVVNCPPGSGKSTLFTMDIPLWLICRDRSIRILIGSSTHRKAVDYVTRIKRALERAKPYGANPALGRDTAAAGCIAVDYGRFRSTVNIGSVWQAEQFVVEQDDDEKPEDKDPTCAAYGFDTEFLGSRANFVIWDDLITSKSLRNPEIVDTQQQKWDEEGETRVEPGGCLILQGQRMGAGDLYRYCLNKRVGTDEDDESEIIGEKMYRHILYPAHFEDRCKGLHKRIEAKAYPEGCLLHPNRIPWYGKSGLLTIRQNRESKYRVQYQQEDVDPESVLVNPLWVAGGRDPETGVQYPGCWDPDRSIAQIPTGLSLPYYSIATADPSPTKYWSVQWWLYHPGSEQRFLLDMYRGNMDAPDFLDWNQNMGVFHGLMEEWQARSITLGAPISHWIVEINAAQRFLLAYDHTTRWKRFRRTEIIPHSTGLNKLDEDYGIQMLKNVYRYGNVRLPGKQLTGSREQVLQLITEATRYPDTRTDDCLMAQWFFEYHLPRLSKPKYDVPKLKRPSWIQRGMTDART